MEEVEKCLKKHSYKEMFSDVKAAVNVILKLEDGRLKTLMIKRAENPRDPWSGDVAFPGGRVEDEDSTFIDTALRETFEEVGISREKLEVLGILEPVHPQSHPEFKVVPVISILKGEEDIVLGVEAVKAFWVDVGNLGREVRVWNPKKKREVEGYVYEGEIIWGMSKRIMDKLIMLVSRCFKS